MMISKVVSRLFVRPQHFRAFCAVTPDFSSVKINEFNRLNTFEYNDIVNALSFAENTEDVALAIEAGHPLMTDRQLAFVLLRMSERKFPLTSGFDRVILPFIKAYTKQYNRHHAQTLAESMIYLGQLGVKDQEFWDLAKGKLIGEKLERYIPLQFLGDLMRAMTDVGQTDAKTLKQLGGQVMKHKAALPKEDIESAIYAFEAAGEASETIRKALGTSEEAGAQTATKSLA